MAHHKSAQKRIRQTERRTEVNRNRRSRVRTFVKKVELAIAAGDKVAAQAAFVVAEPELRRGVTKGVVKLNTVSRKISRLSARIKALA
jgi:small subunit ribosomal protein S20